jgi:hypothetical protein
MNPSGFFFDIDAEIQKIRNPPANPANPANPETENIEISKISNFSNGVTQKTLSNQEAPEDKLKEFNEKIRKLVSAEYLTDEVGTKETDNGLTLDNIPKNIATLDNSRAYKLRGYIKIFSEKLQSEVYLIQNNNVKTPDPNLAAYTETEVKAIKGLSQSELMTMHDAKCIFPGVISNEK